MCCPRFCARLRRHPMAETRCGSGRLRLANYERQRRAGHRVNFLENRGGLAPTSYRQAVGRAPVFADLCGNLDAGR
jgi:hypothetical protein